MNSLLREFRDFFVSLKLTVVLLALSITLVFWATLGQADLGVWGVQQKFFHSLFVLEHFRGSDIPIPVFPGGYFIGGLLLINLLAAHIYRFRLAWKKTGIILAHTGLILLLVGELLSGLLQQDYNMRLAEGETKNYSESPRFVELALTDTTDPKFDDVVVIPEAVLARGAPIQHPKLPFRVVVNEYFPNARVRPRDATDQQIATHGFGLNFAPIPIPFSYDEAQPNLPAAVIELVGPGGSLGSWLVTTALLQEGRLMPLAPQHFSDANGHSWKISLRPKRAYHPFSVSLLKFSHDVYSGTDIPKNFSSRVRLQAPATGDDREVLIYMNNPLRYGGLTFYQSGYEGEHTTILQVVRNPSWLMPYIACLMIVGGLVVQFGIHLGGFIQRQRQPGRASRSTNAGGSGDSASTSEPAWLRWASVATIAVGFASLGASLSTPKNPATFNVVDFGKLPVLANGRIKPLDTVARTSLLQLQHHDSVPTPDHRAPTMSEWWHRATGGAPLPRAARRLTATEWLLDVSFRPEVADTYQIFRIVTPDVLTLFDLTPADGRNGKYFSFQQLSKKLEELEKQARLAEPVENAVRSPFQRGVLQLYENLVQYQRLHYAFTSPGSNEFLGELLGLQDKLTESIEAVRAKQAGQPHDEAIVNRVIDLGQRFSVMADSTNLMVVPPSSDDARKDDWKTIGGALLDTFATGRVSPHALAYAGLGHAWRNNQPDRFNELLSLYRTDLNKHLAPELSKASTESRFNAADVFTSSFTFYAIAFIIAILSWLTWPQALGRVAFWFVGIAWVLATAGIVTRMWLEGRPPVTNLYSSALFVGWVAVALCLILEWIYRNAVGSVAAGMVGFITLIIADRLNMNGDTLEMMRAVLDSNFWLATHVVVVASGYASTFLAGFLALIYIVRGVLTPSLDKATADSLTRMVYGIVCFATLFSFTGTVLGGIWADQSWGRFWGWDPKENGALIIVIWNAIILHARWGGMIKQRGLMAMAVFGNIVTSWSWFGTNMLGVGLHSYGFTDAAFWALSAFVVSQLGFIAVALIPLEHWRSFRPAIKADARAPAAVG
jgi:ABC-type transport system involved in cytochrome c biogenesis permease subunit